MKTYVRALAEEQFNSVYIDMVVPSLWLDLVICQSCTLRVAAAMGIPSFSRPTDSPNLSCITTDFHCLAK